MSDAWTPSAQIEQARELFFAQQRDPEDRVAPHIARSWQRSRLLTRCNADPAPLALALLDERREQAMRLLACAQPELDGLAEHAIVNGCVVVLSDASGLILEEIGSPDFLPKAERIALKPGVEWSEGRRGTNAIGTAIIEREALMVLGGEHYLPENGGLGCAAAPIFSARGEVIGALDISGEAARVNQHALGLVRMAAQQVEHRMMLAEANGHVLRFHRRPALLGTAREGVLVIDDGRIVGANRAALDMLGSPRERLLGRRVEPLLGARWGRLERQRGLLTLPGGQQIAALMERSGSAAAGRLFHRAADRAAPPDTAPDMTPDRAPPAADALQPLLHRAVRVLDEGVAVLVTGETGSGKEVFARRLHAASRRSAGPFVAVNCAALPEHLIEAELFGYEEGAFTGARRRGMPGRIREAHRGVLFLDEMADMPLALQTRLLRVLEDRVVMALGGGTAVPVDFDLVCATHGDLPALSAAGRFRRDLYYRVAGFTVLLPPLRQRSDRDALIARLFADGGGTAKQLRLDAAALQRLSAHDWPGNVRELRSVLRAIVALAEPGDLISVAQLPLPLQGAAPGLQASMPSQVAPPEPQRLADLAQSAIEQMLEDCGQNVAEAARRLGVHRSTVYRHRARRRLAMV
jgi:transcriptional regulator of acetoin/glycerol metabolism